MQAVDGMASAKTLAAKEIQDEKEEAARKKNFILLIISVVLMVSHPSGNLIPIRKAEADKHLVRSNRRRRSRRSCRVCFACPCDLHCWRGRQSRARCVRYDKRSQLGRGQHPRHAGGCWCDHENYAQWSRYRERRESPQRYDL